MSKKIEINKKGKVCIEWTVRPEDYTQEKIGNIISSFANKYGISKDSIVIEPKFIKDGDTATLTSDISNNIQDPKFQLQLFKKYLENGSFEDYDFDLITDIDNQVNSMIDYELYDKFRRYQIKWIKWSNFLSFGNNNFIDFTKLKGLVLLSGSPKNQSGKSTISVNLLKFLLFGTTDKTDVLSEIFNIYYPEETEVTVEGCLNIDGDDYIIKRTLSRVDFKKRTEKSKVTQKVEYFKIVNNIISNLEDVDTERQEEDTNTQTNRIIKDAVGNEKDFDLIISANSHTLNDLINMGTTEVGRTFSKWTGLSVIGDKEKIAKEIFKGVSANLYSNKYNRVTLKQEILDLTNTNLSNAGEVDKLEKIIKESNLKLENFEKEKDNLFTQRKNVDESLTTIDVKTIETQRDSFYQSGVAKKVEKEAKEKELIGYKDLKFSQEDYDKKVKEESELTFNIKTIKLEIGQLKATNENLKNSEVCPTCKRKLEGVDYTNEIKENEEKINLKIENGVNEDKKLKKIQSEIENLKQLRADYDKKSKLELAIAKLDVEINNLRELYKEKSQIIKSYTDNKEIIAKNNEINNKINIIAQNIKVEKEFRDGSISKNEALKAQIKVDEKGITERNFIIGKIEKEEKLIKNWKIYLDMVGKNGVNKMVLRNIIPIINGELQRMLNNVCDFDVRVEINNSNEVAFFLERDGVKSKLMSGSGFEQTAASLALRTVLANISTMPRPNFLVLDEVLGGVASENYDNMKLLYDKIIEKYSFVLHITHLNDIADWHEQNIIVEKSKNMSTVKVQ